MKILWMTWKDPTHPEAGGAEVVQRELCSRLVADGHQVLVLTAGYTGAKPLEENEGLTVVRLGSRFARYLVYYHAWRYYRAHLRGWADLVIDEVNTVPFFARFYVREKHILFVHQLARAIWFYQMPFPLSTIGYCVEPLMLRVLSRTPVITVSESTSRDLMRHGFREKNISIISEGIELSPIIDLSAVEKFRVPTVLALGSIRPMKRTLHIVEAFLILKERFPAAELIIAGDDTGTYAQKVKRAIKQSKHQASIRLCGRVSRDEKITLMQRAHVLAAASVKEGWGLVVTEAASQGTPSVAYAVDGLRDSIRDRETGLLARENTPQGLADALARLLHMSPEAYARMQGVGHAWSQDITFDHSYNDFLNAIEKKETGQGL